MCGILALFGELARDRRRASAALDRLAHRGPDGRGEWVSADGAAWLGHRRLAIVDLTEAGDQPMVLPERGLVLVCNGEIYNYPALRKELEGRGARFESHCDSEVVLHAYDAWGEGCLDRFEGMFAFALWDDRERRLFAARDPVGIKPLCFAETDGGLALASEAEAVKPFLAAPSPDPLALAYVLTLGYVPSPLCVWRGVRKLEPGHCLTWRPGAPPRVRRYWEPPRHVDPSPGDVGEWRGLFETVLREHLLADVPVGLFLSGGLDSSSVAAGLAEAGRRIETVTVSFPGSADDESPVAAAVAERFGFPHEVIPVESGDVFGLLERVSAAYDEPQGYSSLLTMYAISAAAARRFKTVLSGDGGDETFGGYTWHRGLAARAPGLWPLARRVLGPWLRRSSWPKLYDLTETAFRRSSLLRRHAWRLYPRFLPEEVTDLLAPTGLRFDDDALLAPFRKHFEPALPARRALQRVDLMTFCSGSILPKVDRASMAHSLEVRVPFLDRRIIEWALTRPPDPREDREGKPLLRDYLRPRVPAEVLDHPKQGFSLRGMETFDWAAALDRVRRGYWAREGWLGPAWRRLTAPAAPRQKQRLWTLLALTLWMDRHA